MERAEIKEIVRNWVFPTEKSSYMGGIEDAPVLAKSHGSTVVDTDGKEYLDFQSGQMGAALSGQNMHLAMRREQPIDDAASHEPGAACDGDVHCTS